MSDDVGPRAPACGARSTERFWFLRVLDTGVPRGDEPLRSVVGTDLFLPDDRDRLWFPGSELKRGFVAWYGQRMVCGAIAGGAIGFPVLRSAEGIYALDGRNDSWAGVGYLNRPKIKVRG
jgi:hypothetical protein